MSTSRIVTSCEFFSKIFVFTAIYGMVCGGNVAIANQVPQISEFPRYEGSASYLQPVAQVTPENTPASTEEPDIELTVIEKLLNEPVYSPFRREGTVVRVEVCIAATPLPSETVRAAFTAHGYSVCCPFVNRDFLTA